MSRYALVVHDPRASAIALLAPRLAALVLLGLVAGPLAAQEAVPDSVTPARIVEGSELFHTGSCARCHAVGGRGVGRNGPDLSDAVWLHGGDYDSIFHTIWWGVETDEMKAEPRFRFEMHPRGGMPWTRQQSLTAAAYVWSISRPATHPLVTRQMEFLSHARGGQVDRALEVFEQASAEGQALFTEGAINTLGYAILESDVDGAIGLFELNTRLHPESWNVWDSLGEAYAKKGDRAKAIEHYEKSVQLNPQNEEGKQKLAELRAGT